jgi:hypothetical protein
VMGVLGSVDLIYVRGRGCEAERLRGGLEASSADVPWVPGYTVTFVSYVEESRSFSKAVWHAGDVYRLTAVVGGKTT